MMLENISLNELSKVCRAIKDRLGSSGVILLNGTLGAGKTTLVKEFAKEYLGSCDAVTSPTFSTMQQYGNNIFHYDLYLKDDEYIFTSSLFEMFNFDGYHFIEWANNKLREFLLKCRVSFIDVTITVNKDSRSYDIDG